ncbi:MAG: GNAT family N-acetyltransferase [Chromatiales bacterium]|nr:GNAT family N-acetyltransferase [Chromatiales bacterium]
MEFALYTSMEQLPASAGALFSQGARDSMFLSQQWFENLANTAVDSITLACVEQDGGMLAILPLMECASNRCYALRHRYTSLYSLLLADGNRQQMLECLLHGLCKSGYGSLLLEPVAAIDDRLDSLQRCMEASGSNCYRSFRFYNWFHKVAGQSYTDYMRDRPGRLRNTITRKSRKLEREHGYSVRLFIGEEVPQAMPDYYAVYGSSWKANEQYSDLLDGLATVFSKEGWSRLGVLYIKGRPAAAQLWFVLHGKANIFRLAYDETWKRYSPGSLLTSHMMEHAIDVDRVEEIDFLVGNETYKQDWMSERRERWALSCVRSGKPAGKLERFMGSLKHILKRRRTE